MKNFKNIVYIMESDVLSGQSLETAVSFARTHQADLTLLDVIPDITSRMRPLSRGPSAAEIQQALVAQRREALERVAASFQGKPGVSVVVAVGRNFLEIIRMVLRNGYDLLIKPAEDPDWSDRLLGNTDMHLLRKCPCPVWLINPDAPAGFRTVVAAIDFNPVFPDDDEEALNRTILEVSSSIALSNSAALHVIHSWEAPLAGFASMWADDQEATEEAFTEGEARRHRSYMSGIQRQLAEDIGSDVFSYLLPQFHLPMGAAVTTIPSMVDQFGADLLVMGTVARAGIPGLLIGNTAEAILNQVSCSVLAVKPPGFVTPVEIEDNGK